ncbi:MAG: hypothetical protein JOZ16_12445, partial [Methylobacteriaceae bacterium]|nr:hypothetical protein [Methylobacteriaceae bacterium]
VAFAGRSVVIARRVAGIAMQVRVPLTSYRGVRLSLGSAEGEALHTIELLHHDPDLSVPLFQAADPRVVEAEWCAWANSLSLPRLFEDFPADSRPAQTNLPEPRRRGSMVAKRRTRFSRRRKAGAQQRLAVMHTGEREIISYE